MGRSLIPTLLDEIQDIQNFKNFFGDNDPDLLPSWRHEMSNLSVYEDGDSVYVEAGMPGLETEDINVNLQKGVLWIDGKSEKKEDDKRRKYHMRSSSCFSYRVSLPCPIDESLNPKASYKNGVLKIKLDKSKAEKPKNIKVEIE